ncbi:bifunctional 3-(3-hydroxy-phenyl)propionate/3-hydroxycinnamic acid hydroxylase [Bacillus sp. EB106-08-02-XG196]|uniref:bifunctional 3-(3-hydroxy-phenyl)propionate/3-hydroxycinnamic acid hydroxylase MhpA n=1 Tax=Bacillus sp. EB106-08-02-XG196 TaxID=2737049 RepID=UPI0015C41952|nr:bifunctional 3-(3-hydroxy-phenyl)propionate/3-hydroxycinnamic acid hydroxylase [Bacillus sp. EB106-08-02-XG196]NWQ44022.1 bifunctional 3-(3-hydroxy-phenyl)propionate/3-hydroxycinnamic acid hydroxylase [Bacillus sp. EB106-08-02-XG196]
MKQEMVDVAIVGYGPVSKLLAALLGQKGWRVGVYERFSEPYPLPRAVHLDDEIARMLQSILPKSEIERILQPVPDLYEWRNAEQQLLLALDFSQDGISGWPGHLFFNQPELEKVMDVACRNQPSVNVNMGNDAIELKEFENHVELTVKDLHGEIRTIHAKYVVGCDGANSFVRKNMDPAITDLGFAADWLVVDIVTKEEREWNPMNLQLCDPARPTTVVSGGPGKRRWEFMALPGETKEGLNNEDVAWRLLEPWNITPSNAVLERHAVYTFKALWADEWQKGRLIIAGDAAHLTPPFMGQGMCSGLRDSINLAWKLDLILSGKAAESILETYTAERKPHNREVVEAALFLGNVICVTDPVEARKRDEAFFTGGVPEFPEFPFLTEGILYQSADGKNNKYTGKLSFQGQVEYRGKSGLFDDVVGSGWTIISPVNDPKKVLNEEQIAFLEDIGVKFIEISELSEDNESFSEKAVDIHGKYKQYFKETGLEVVVVRPDFYLFGGTESLADLPLLVEDLSKQFDRFRIPALNN